MSSSPSSDDGLLRELAGSIEARAAVDRLNFRGTARHRPVRRLGEGSFGVVYEANDVTLGCRVAIKVLRIQTAETLYRFKREFRQTRDIHHPNLVRLHELYHAEGEWVLVMELVEGEPLLRFLARNPGSLSRAFGQLASGLCALHHAGRIHRDVKPDNVLVDSSGRVVLVDFGMAKDAGGSTAVGGTPQYAAPEQWLSGTATFASDWYAFGSVLFEALHGKRPFEGSGSTLFENKAQGLPPRPSEPHPIPELDRLARRLLAHEPSARPKGGEVLDLLLGGRASEAPVPRRSEFVGRDAELMILDQAFAAGAGVVWIQGLSGIGKTALVEQWLSGLPDQTLVLRGQCYDTETIRFKALDGAIDDLVRFLCRLPEVDAAALAPRDPGAAADAFPVLRRVPLFARAAHPLKDPGARMAAAVEAVRELFTRCADLGPIVVFLDDVHALDSDGARMLQLLTAGSDAPQVLFVLTVRDDLADLIRAVRVQLESLSQRFLHLQVAPLGSRACLELARILADTEMGTEEELAVVHESLGIPVFVRELVEHRAEQAATPRLKDAIGSRIAKLSLTEQRILLLLAVAGTPVSEVVCLARDEARLGALDSLIAADLVRSMGASPRSFVLRHDRIRGAILDRASESERVLAHSELARLLELYEPDDVGGIAKHYRLSGNLGQALSASQEAARAAEASLAYSTAAALWGVAADLASDGSERARLLERQAAMLEASGAPGHAARVWLDAAILTGDDALRIRAARQSLLNGDIARGLSAIEPTLAAFSVEVPPAGVAGMAISVNHSAHLVAHGLHFVERSDSDLESADLQRLELLLTLAWSLSFHDLRALPLSALALRFALELGEPERVQRAAALYVFNHSPPLTRFPSVERAFALSAGLIARLGEDAKRWHLLALGARELFRANHQAAMSAFREIEQDGTAADPRQISAARAAWMMTAVTQLFDLRDVIATVPVWRREAEVRGDRFLSSTLDVFSVPYLLAADRWRECGPHLDQAEAQAPPDDDSVFIPIVRLMRFQVALYARRSDLPLRLRMLRETLGNHPALLSPYIAGVFHGLCAAAVLSANALDLSLADEHLAAMERIPPIAGPRLKGLRAQLLFRRGATREATSVSLEFIQDLEELGSPVLLAHARLQLDRLRHGNGAIGRQAYRDLKDLGVADPVSHGESLFGRSRDVGS